MLLLVTGHPRSGTTLLQQLCDRHPSLGMTNEFGCFNYLDRPYSDHACAMLSRWQEVEGRWPYKKAYAGQSRRKFRKWLNLFFTLRYLSALGRRGLGEVTVPRAYQAYLQLFPEAAIVGDKLPGYLFCIEKFTGIAEMKRVVIYRDCRDVVSSFLVKTRTDWHAMDWVKRVDTATKIAQRWVEGINRMELHAEHLHLLCYESLVQQPHREVARLAEYLGVEAQGFAPDMVRTDKVGKHRQGLTQAELDGILEIAGAAMGRLGYV